MLQWDPAASSYSEACRYVSVGRRLSTLRHALGLTQRQLAANLNITGPRWANYEVGTSRIPVDVALQLVEKWEVSLDWIYYGNVDLLQFSGGRFSSYPASLSNCTGLT